MLGSRVGAVRRGGGGAVRARLSPGDAIGELMVHDGPSSGAERSPLRPSPNWFVVGGGEYARARPDYPPEVVRYLADAVAGPRSGRGARGSRVVLDVGCGAGQFTHQLADRFEQVVGIDPSIDQLAHAPDHPGVRYVCGAAESLPISGGRAALITVAQAAHWFDLDRFWGEVRRVAIDGALVALITYGIADVGPREAGGGGRTDREAALVAERFTRFLRADLAGFWPPERRLVDRRYADIEMPFEELDAPSAVMRRWWDLDALLAYVSTWSALRAAHDAGRGDVLRAFAEDMEALWGPRRDTRLVQWPVTMRVGRVGSPRSRAAFTGRSHPRPADRPRPPAGS